LPSTRSTRSWAQATWYWGYLLPIIPIAIYYGSTLAIFTSFASGLAASYLLFPPVFSFYIADIKHIAEFGFFLLLASVASKAVAVLTEDGRNKGIRPLRRRL
jgi:K+-sensing histidine kinase KdpD